eukprot:6183831-Pleurochrysis_carterae.AAC.5
MSSKNLLASMMLREGDAAAGGGRFMHCGRLGARGGTHQGLHAWGNTVERAGRQALQGERARR